VQEFLELMRGSFGSYGSQAEESQGWNFNWTTNYAGQHSSMTELDPNNFDQNLHKTFAQIPTSHHDCFTPLIAYQLSFIDRLTEPFITQLKQRSFIRLKDRALGALKGNRELYDEPCGSITDCSASYHNIRKSFPQQMVG
jgi:hypothetical protein